MRMKKYFIILILLIASKGCPSLAQQRGTASYYSNRMHGRRMSNGERYHKDSLTCAHARYALGSLLKVTNIKNGKSVVVEVTDRCAKHARRIIDLSYAAAKQIGILSQGVATVMVEKFKEKHGVPYRDNEVRDLPELDFETTKGVPDYSPAWRKKKQTHTETNTENKK